MTESSNPLYDKKILDFVTVAFEYCAWLEASEGEPMLPFVDKATKLLPLLYLKATLLPDMEEEEELLFDTPQFIDNPTYERIRQRVATTLGKQDSYLETFVEEMQYSETPVAASIAENMADTFQALGDFVALFRQGEDATMLQALLLCKEQFRLYWGQSILNALKALHAIRYNEEIITEEKAKEEE